MDAQRVVKKGDGGNKIMDLFSTQVHGLSDSSLPFRLSDSEGEGRVRQSVIDEAQDYDGDLLQIIIKELFVSMHKWSILKVDQVRMFVNPQRWLC